MEIQYNNDTKVMSFIFSDRTFELHNMEPKIEETGDRGYINEENLFHVERILSLVKSNSELINYCMGRVKLGDKFEVLIYFIPFLCKFYSTPEYDFDKLKKRSWDYIFRLKVIENWAYGKK